MELDFVISPAGRVHPAGRLHPAGDRAGYPPGHGGVGKVPTGRCSSVVDDGLQSMVFNELAAGWVQPSWRFLEDVLPAAAGLLGLSPGPRLLAAVTQLQGEFDALGGVCPVEHPPSRSGPIGVPGVPCCCMVIVAAAWQAVASWVQQAADQHLVSAVGACRQRVQVGRREVSDPGVEEFAVGLRATPGGMDTRVTKARRRHQHPDLCAAIAAGKLPGWQADLLLDDLRGYAPDVVDTVLADVLATVDQRWRQGLVSWTLPNLRQGVKRRAARLDQRGLAGKRSAARRRRGVRSRCHGDGASTISIDVVDDVAAQILGHLTTLAERLDAGGECRSLAQRRCDVAVDLLLADPAELPGAGSPASGEVAVVVSAATLLGLTDDPAELGDGTPVPAEVARIIAADRRWRLWLTTADGHVVATSPTTYRPSAALARLIRAREPMCRMPGCRNQRVDRDHTIPFDPLGNGPTDAQNLGSLCRRHHVLKTHANWQLHNQPGRTDGPSNYTWTTPAGIGYTDRPRPPLRQ